MYKTLQSQIPYPAFTYLWTFVRGWNHNQTHTNRERPDIDTWKSHAWIIKDYLSIWEGLYFLRKTLERDLKVKLVQQIC